MRLRKGFALLAVLWVTLALSGLALAGVAGARTAGAITRNRLALTRGRWAAEGCLAVALARLDSMARSGLLIALDPAAGDTLHFADGAQCTVSSVDPGTRLNADSASREMLVRLQQIAAEAGIGSPETLLTRDGDGRVNLNAAPAAVLAALPGFTSRAVRAVLELRRWREPIRDLFQVLGRVDPVSREELLSRYGELLRRVSFAPTSLVVTATGWSPGVPAKAAIEVVVVPAGPRAAVVRRRIL